jgi:hypothetical protein
MVSMPNGKGNAKMGERLIKSPPDDSYDDSCRYSTTKNASVRSSGHTESVPEPNYGRKRKLFVV